MPILTKLLANFVLLIFAGHVPIAWQSGFFFGSNYTVAAGGGGTISYVGSFAGGNNQSAGLTSTTFTGAATHANDAIALTTTCSSGNVTAFSLSATGWTITQIGSTTDATTNISHAVWGAISPNTSTATFTVSFTLSSGNCNGFIDWISDEFTGNDTTGGTTTFDSHNFANVTSTGTVSCTPGNNNDALWGVAIPPGSATVGSGFNAGSSDGSGNIGEYKILSGGSGVSQSVTWATFTGGSGDSSCMTIKP